MLSLLPDETAAQFPWTPRKENRLEGVWEKSQAGGAAKVFKQAPGWQEAPETHVRQVWSSGIP